MASHLATLKGSMIQVSLDSIDPRRRKKGGPFQLKVWNQQSGITLEGFGRYTPPKKEGAKPGEKLFGTWENREDTLSRLQGCLERYEDIGISVGVGQLFPEVKRH